MEQKNSYLIFFPWKSIASFFTSSCVTIKVWTKLTRIEILSKHNEVKSSLKEQKNSYSILFPWNLLVPRKSTSIASSFIPISLSITNETQPPRKATREEILSKAKDNEVGSSEEEEKKWNLFIPRKSSFQSAGKTHLPRKLSRISRRKILSRNATDKVPFRKGSEFMQTCKYTLITHEANERA